MYNTCMIYEKADITQQKIKTTLFGHVIYKLSRHFKYSLLSLNNLPALIHLDYNISYSVILYITDGYPSIKQIVSAITVPSYSDDASKSWPGAEAAVDENLLACRELEWTLPLGECLIQRCKCEHYESLYGNFQKNRVNPQFSHYKILTVQEKWFIQLMQIAKKKRYEL